MTSECTGQLVLIWGDLIGNLIAMLLVKRGIAFSRATSSTLVPDMFFPQFFCHTVQSNSRVSQISKLVLTFLVMSEMQWKAVENVIFLVSGAS